MRLTLKKVEQAKKTIREAKGLTEMVKTWNEAVKEIGDVGENTISVINIKDNKITFECEHDETAGKPILQAAEK